MRIFAIFFLLSCTQLGQLPDKDGLVAMQKSRNYDPVAEVFVNQDRGVIERLRAKRHSRWSMFTRWLFQPDGVVPERKMPEGDPALAKFIAADGKLKTIWLGHSTILLNIDGNIIMFDPVFSASASPLPFMVKRYQPPVVKLASLPKIDFIVISHDHYDHLDQGTVKHFIDASDAFLGAAGGWVTSQVLGHSACSYH